MDKKAVVLVENDYEDLELWYPYLRLKEEGYDVTLVGPEGNTEYKSKHGYTVVSQMNRFDGKKQEWDIVIIPGGWAPDKLRRYPEIVEIVQNTHASNGLVAAICHGGSLLVSAGIVKGITLTSFSAIKDDLIYAGCDWVDREVVNDGNIITSRTPQDLPVFMKTIVEALR